MKKINDANLLMTLSLLILLFCIFNSAVMLINTNATYYVSVFPMLCFISIINIFIEPLLIIPWFISFALYSIAIFLNKNMGAIIHNSIKTITTILWGGNLLTLILMIIDKIWNPLGGIIG